MTDTSPEIEARFRAMVLARPPGGERLKITSAMFDMTRQLMIAAIKDARPEITEVELRQKLFLRYYSQDFTPEQRGKILSGIVTYWARHECSRRKEPHTRPAG